MQPPIGMVRIGGTGHARLCNHNIVPSPAPIARMASGFYIQSMRRTKPERAMNVPPTVTDRAFARLAEIAN